MQVERLQVRDASRATASVSATTCSICCGGRAFGMHERHEEERFLPRLRERVVMAVAQPLFRKAQGIRIRRVCLGRSTKTGRAGTGPERGSATDVRAVRRANGPGGRPWRPRSREGTAAGPCSTRRRTTTRTCRGGFPPGLRRVQRKPEIVDLPPLGSVVQTGRDADRRVPVSLHHVALRRACAHRRPAGADSHAAGRQKMKRVLMKFDLCSVTIVSSSRLFVAVLFSLRSSSGSKTIVARRSPRECPPPSPCGR